MRSSLTNRPAGRAVMLAAALASAAALPSGMALAANSTASPGRSHGDHHLVPARCFAKAKTKHVVFGSNSFFEPPSQQGPTSFHENSGPTIVTYPLHQGTSRRGRVLYVITDASKRSVAQALGVNFAPKLGKAAGTIAVENSGSHIRNGNGIRFTATVNFAPVHVLVPSATGFPPAKAAPGAVGRPGYSPLVQVVFRGHTVVLNAPQIANSTGRADKVVSMTPHTVQYRETDGCYDDESVHYVSFDSSSPVAAAIEDVTYAPNLNAVPSAGCADPMGTRPCGRESLIAFTNGQTGSNNVQRQGLNAAILDHLSPLNNLQEVPHPGALFDYSPMWDIHLATWTAAAIAAGQNVRQTDFSAALKQVTNGLATGFPAGAQFGPSGFVVNCPVVSLDVNTEH